ncbi:MAG: GNAT family N-acetyltransferase [Lentisphaerae bacterium]|nr:GNAT family N-acetyltransferase [Lentisphaerota bacterium]
MATLIKKGDPRKVSSIVLGKDKYLDQLYGCFRFNNPKGDAFAPERDVEIVFKSGKKIHVTVPESLKLELPANTKAVNTPFFRLKEIGKYRDSMHLLTMRAGWNQNERDIHRMIDLDPHGSFVALLSGLPIGTASVLPLGRNNTWIGMILVHPELRRQGLANAMMQHCVKYAIDSGKIVNGLDATPMGNTVYGAVGYVNSFRLWRSTYELKEFAGAAFDSLHVQAMTKTDLPDVIRYDASSFVERVEIMEALFADGGPGACFVYRNDEGVVQGYCFTRPGRIRPFVGPFIADTDDIARHLLVAASQHLLKANPAAATALIDTPEEKFADPGVYVERVFDQERKPSAHRLIKSIVCVRDFTRMYQLVRDTDVGRLVAQFKAAEKMDDASPRVREFRETMEKSVMNYTQTLAFMNYERETLQKKYWGITGPEKG